MARCHKCQKKLSLLEKDKVFRTVEGKSSLFCGPCAKSWDQEQKRYALSTLCEGGDPIGIFTIPRVKTLDPDNPTKPQLLGHLIFTNKAVCFAQIAEGKEQVEVESGGLFGAIGAMVEAAVKAEQKIRAENKIFAHAEEAKGMERSRNFREVLEKADRLIVFPKETITDMRYSRWFSFKIKTRNGSQSFVLEGNQAETYRRFEPRIKEYLNH